MIYTNISAGKGQCDMAKIGIGQLAPDAYNGIASCAD